MAKFTAVKVLNASGSGTVSDIIKAVTWITKKPEQKVGKAHASHFTKNFKGSVAALSMKDIAASLSPQKAINYCHYCRDSLRRRRC